MSNMPTLALTPCYRLVEGLLVSVASEAIQPAAPEEADREELLFAKLGGRGWRRVRDFRYHYDQGWGEASRPALSPKALDAFFRFLGKVTFPPRVVPSVFLTDEGGLELAWEDSAGHPVQVEFHSQGVGYYQAASNDEGEVHFRELGNLARRLSV